MKIPPFYLLFVVSIVLIFIQGQGCDQSPTEDSPSTVQWNNEGDSSGTSIVFNGKIIYTSQSMDHGGFTFTRIIILNSTDKSVYTFRSTEGIYEEISSSPDGKKLAYIKRSDGHRSLYVSTIDSNSTSDSIVVSGSSSGDPRRPSWTQSNELVYFIDKNPFQVYCGKTIVDLNQKAYKGRIAFTHDGKSMIYSAYDDSLRVSLYRLDISSGVTRLLVKADSMKSFGKIYNPAISPDDSRIVFSIYNTSDLAYYHSEEIWISNIDGSNLKKVCSDGSMLAWSPDGNKIAFVGTIQPCIFLINTDGTNKTHINTGWTNEFVWIY